MKDCAAKGRMFQQKNGHLAFVAKPESFPLRARGSNNGASKMTAEKVFEMRRLYVETVTSYRNLASKYGLSNGTVGEILRGETWRHVAIPTPKGYRR